MGRYVTILILSVVCATAQAEVHTLKDVAATESLSKDIAKLIAVGDLKGAYGLLKPYWPIPEHEIDGLVYKAEGQRPTIAARFGNSLSVEPAGTQVLGDSFVRYIFLEKYERHAIVWAFTFYRPGDSWIVNSAIFTDQFSAMFEWLPGALGSPKTGSQQATTPPNKALQLTGYTRASLPLW